MTESYPSTFSLVARDPDNNDLGVIVQSKFPAVGTIVPWASAGVGAVATQALANTSYGPEGLKLLVKGKSAPETMKLLLQRDDRRMVEHRQVGIVDAKGRAAAYTGRQCMEWAGHIVGDGYTCQGNILAGEAVVGSMAQTFERAPGDLIDRLFAALNAAQKQGGDRRGMQSAAILVVRQAGGYGGGSDRYVDVRVDDHPQPIAELERIFGIYDMTLLSREDPSRLVAIEGGIAVQIQEALKTLGYMRTVSRDAFTPEAADALHRFISVNNFENKERTDGTIWQSVLDFLLRQSEIPNR